MGEKLFASEGLISLMCRPAGAAVPGGRGGLLLRRGKASAPTLPGTGAAGQLRGCSAQQPPARHRALLRQALRQLANSRTDIQLLLGSPGSGQGDGGSELPVVPRAPVKCGVSSALPARAATGQKCTWALGDRGHRRAEPGPVRAALTSSALCACGWLSRKVPSSTEATMVRPLPALSCDVKDRSCGCTTFCSWSPRTSTSSCGLEGRSCSQHPSGPRRSPPRLSPRRPGSPPVLGVGGPLLQPQQGVAGCAQGQTPDTIAPLLLRPAASGTA